MPLLNSIIDLLLAPFRHLPPEVGLAAFAIVTGLVVLLIFKVTSTPARVAAARLVRAGRAQRASAISTCPSR